MQAHLRFIASSTAQIRLWPMAWRKFLFFRSSSRPLRARPALDSKPTVSLNCRAARQVFWRRFLCSSAVSSAAAQRPWWSLPSGRPAIRSACFASGSPSPFPSPSPSRDLSAPPCIKSQSVLRVPDCTSRRPIRPRRRHIAR